MTKRNEEIRHAMRREFAALNEMFELVNAEPKGVE